MLRDAGDPCALERGQSSEDPKTERETGERSDI